MIDLATVKPGDMRAVKVVEVKSYGVTITERTGIERNLLHPLPTDPHAALRDAVIEAAREWRDSIAIGPGDVLRRAVDALNAAMAPPDPVGELLKQASGAVYQLELQKCPTGASLLRAAIRAVEAMRREG